MRDCVDEEIIPDCIISYAQRKGDTGGLTIAHVLSVNKDTLKVEIPTDDWHVYWKNGDFKQGSFGTRKRFLAKKVTFQYPQRATVLINKTYEWWLEKFRIGQTEYKKDLNTEWPYQYETVETEEELLT